MRLSNKSTFSLVCLVLLFAFAAMPAMAQINKMSAEWISDLKLDNADTTVEPGWKVKVTLATAPATNTNLTATATNATASAVTPDANGTAKVFTFNVALNSGSETADSDVITAGAFSSRRVTLMNGQNLADTSIKLPVLQSITAPKSSNGESTIDVKIQFSIPALLASPSGPAIGLRSSDIKFIPDGGGTVASISELSSGGIYTVKILIGSADTTISLGAGNAVTFPHAAGSDTTDDTATVVYDVIRPVIGAITFTRIGSNRILDTTNVSEPFDINVVVTDDTVVGTPTTFDLDVDFAVSGGAMGATPSNDGKIVGVDNTYAATITPNANTTPTNWDATPITITITVTDDAGNAISRTAPVVTLAARPGVAATPAMIQTTALGDTTPGGMLTVTFDKDPGTVATTATGYTITGTGTTRMIMVPADKAAGSYSIALTWAHGGTGTVTYTIPADAANESPAIMIPANGFVVVVRDTMKETGEDGVVMDVGQDAILRAYGIMDAGLAAWPMMPDLQNLFDTSAIHGAGALALMDTATGDDRVDPGTVGISEIMWAIDLSQLGQAGPQRHAQWIELHNLNTKAVTVKLSYEKGAKKIGDADGDVDFLRGDLAKPYLDAVTNAFDDRPGSPVWSLPGENGNPRTGTNFVSAARTGEFNLTSQHQGKHNKRYTRTGNGNSANSPDGRNGYTTNHTSTSWAKSTTSYARGSHTLGSGLGNVFYDYVGTPGRVNTFSPDRATRTDPRTDINPGGIIINEVSNRDDANNQYEWIELKNVSTGEINLNNYQISILTGVDKDEPFIFLPNNNNSKIPAGGVLLLVDSDPFGDPDHPLAVGWKIGKNPEDQVPGLESIGISGTSKEGRYLVVPFGGKNNKFITGLPDDGNFILVVRSQDNHESDHNHGDKGRAELGAADLGRIVDIAGYVGGLHKPNYTNSASSTNLWPLKSQGSPDDKNKLTANKVRFRRNVSTRDGRAGTGNTHNDRKVDQLAFKDVGYSGIGYKRQATNSAIHGGTPGYLNGAQRGRVSELAMAKLKISEIMLYQGEEGARTKLPQWIEIYNPSDHPVGLGGWRLIIENPRVPIRTINLGGGSVKTILSKQTILIVSGSARDIGSDTLPSSTLFPPTRVYNVYKHQKNEFNMTSRFDPILDQEAFHITLIDGAALDLNNAAQKAIADDPTKSLRVGGSYYTISDVVGNLDGNPRTNDMPEDNGKMKFEMGMTEDGDRTSIIRIFDNGTARDGTGMVKPLGGGADVARMKGIDSKFSWVHAADTKNRFVRHTWYGDETDWGTPADRGGQILPVELSFFRPALEDGKVVVRWTTESELDNAGFNILRSETRKGQYKQVNTELIQGAGTTGERTTYNWVDPTAKPGVVYYYQIEDVSFAGEHQVLAITKLKGLISADGKLTTTWSELKQASQ